MADSLGGFVVPERRLRQAFGSLRRIRVADKIEEDGSRTVWHQGGDGVELLSFVDPQGCLESQELVLFGTVVAWSRSNGARTGEVLEDGGSGAIKGSSLVHYDSALSHERLQVARSGLRGYEGDDKYVRKVQAVVEEALEKQSLDEGSVVRTHPGTLLALRSEPSALSRRTAVVVGVGVAAALLVAAAAAGALILAR